MMAEKEDLEEEYRKKLVAGVGTLIPSFIMIGLGFYFLIFAFSPLVGIILLAIGIGILALALVDIFYFWNKIRELRAKSNVVRLKRTD